MKNVLALHSLPERVARAIESRPVWSRSTRYPPQTNIPVRTISFGQKKNKSIIEWLRSVLRDICPYNALNQNLPTWGYPLTRSVYCGAYHRGTWSRMRYLYIYPARLAHFNTWDICILTHFILFLIHFPFLKNARCDIKLYKMLFN